MHLGNRPSTLGETPYARQVALPLEYKGIKLDCGYRMDLVVKALVVVELKCVDKVLPIHEAQLLTYLKLSKIRTGLIINFNTPLLKDGVRRFVL
jgi:GxxExxY protein